jgi:hypothetical protein
MDLLDLNRVITQFSKSDIFIITLLLKLIKTLLFIKIFLKKIFKDQIK